jgi:predicted ATPase
MLERILMISKLKQLFKKKVKRYAIVGAPCSGKTTTIELLEKRGYHVVPEMARDIVKEEQSKKGGSLFPWIVVHKFQLRILRKYLDAEDRIKEGIVFSDRGIGDGLAYYYHEVIRPPEELVKEVKKKRYDTVFYLDALEYKSDRQRNEGKEVASRVGRKILETYRKFGYRVVIVPIMSEEERVDFIVKNI